VRLLVAHAARRHARARPAARRFHAEEEQPLTLSEVEALLGSNALVLDLLVQPALREAREFEVWQP
jgi:hypothetical protein